MIKRSVLSPDNAAAYPVKGRDASDDIGFLAKDTKRNCETENGHCPLAQRHGGSGSSATEVLPNNELHICSLLWKVGTILTDSCL